MAEPRAIAPAAYGQSSAFADPACRYIVVVGGRAFSLAVVALFLALPTAFRAPMREGGSVILL